MTDHADGLSYAVLELNLRAPGDGSYCAELRYQAAGSAAEAQLIDGPDPLVHLDHTHLRALNGDPVAYGRALSDALFADPRMIVALHTARRSAEQAGQLLRFVLRLDLDDPALHTIAWETLRDVRRDEPLANSERLLLSRYLESGDMVPVRRGRPHDLSALVVVAGPADLERFGLGAVDIPAEVARSRAALRQIAPAVIAAGDGRRATFPALSAALRAAPDILYLVCHATVVDGRTYLWLEDDTGLSARVDSEELAGLIAGLARRPQLIVLAACRSAGEPSADAPLAAVGPRLARAGVPAVVAMQGPVAMETVEALMPTFFQELQRDGQIDRALAVARNGVRAHPDWWMPVLFLRTRDGRLWDDPRRNVAALARRYGPPVAAALALDALLLLAFLLLRDRLLLAPALLPPLLVAGAAAAAGLALLLTRRRRPPALLAGTLLAGLLLAGLLGWQAWRALAPQRFAQQQFGIAVARFGQGEGFSGTRLSREVTDQVVRSIELALRERGGADIAVMPAGLVTSSEEAREQGQRLGADLLIWGQVVMLGEGQVTINFEILDVADRSLSPRFPVVLPASSSLPFAYVDTALEAGQIRDLVPQQVNVISAFSLGLAAFYNRDYMTAAREMERADATLGALAVDSAEARRRAGLVKFYLGRALQRVGRLDEGDAQLREAERLLPQDPAVPLSLAYSQRSRGNQPEMERLARAAIAAADAWLADDPANRSVAYNRALAYVLIDQPLRAAADLDAMAAADPAFYAAGVSAGQAYLAAEDYESAADRLGAVVARAEADGEDSSWALLFLGEVAEARGDLEEAQRLTSRAAELAPDVDWMHYRLGQLAAARGDTTTAGAAYERMLTTSFDRAWAHSVRAAFRRSVGDVAGAIADYREARRLRPADTLAQIYLAELLHATGQSRLALQTFAEALGQQPGMLYGRISYGITLFDVGEYGAAAEQFEAALGLAPTSEPARYNLARTYEAAGRSDAARLIYASIVGAPETYSEQIRRSAAERLALLELQPQGAGDSAPTPTVAATPQPPLAATPTATSTLFPTATRAPASPPSTFTPAVPLVTTPTDTSLLISPVPPTTTLSPPASAFETVTAALPQADTPTRTLPPATIGPPRPTDAPTLLPADTPISTLPPATIGPPRPTDAPTLLPADTPTSTLPPATMEPPRPTDAPTLLPADTPTSTRLPEPASPTAVPADTATAAPVPPDTATPETPPEQPGP